MQINIQWTKKVIGKKYVTVKFKFLPQYLVNHKDISRDDVITIFVHDRHVYFDKCYDLQNFIPNQPWRILHLINVVQP